MPTTNPVPSQDPSDLLFNAGKLDEVLNGAGTSFTDRLGTARRTVAGMNADFDAQLADAESDLNVYRADAAASAAQALGYLNTIRTTSYGAYASDPATDPLGNPPNVGDEYFNTTSNLLKRFNGTTWQASDINTANLAAPSGSSLIGYDTGTVQDVLDAVTGSNGAASVGYTPAGAGAVATTVQSKLREKSSINDLDEDVADSVTDASAVAQAVATACDSEKKRYLYIPNWGGSFKWVSPVVFTNPGVRIFGDQSATYNRGTGKDGWLLGQTGLTRFFDLGASRTTGNPADQWKVDGISLKQSTGVSARTIDGIGFTSRTNGPDRGANILDVSFIGLKDAITVENPDVSITLANLNVERSVFQGCESAINAKGRVFGLRFVNNQCEQNIGTNGVIRGYIDGPINISDNMMEGQQNPISIDIPPTFGNSPRMRSEGNYFEANSGEYVYRLRVSTSSCSFKIGPNYNHLISAEDFVLVQDSQGSMMLETLDNFPVCFDNSSVSLKYGSSILSEAVKSYRVRKVASKPAEVIIADYANFTDNDGDYVHALPATGTVLQTPKGNMICAVDSAFVNVPLAVAVGDMVVLNVLCRAEVVADGNLNPQVYDQATVEKVVEWGSSRIAAELAGKWALVSLAFVAIKPATSLRFRLFQASGTFKTAISGISAKNLGSHINDGTVYKTVTPVMPKVQNLEAKLIVDLPSLAIGAGYTQTVTCEGANLGDFVVASLPSDLADVQVTAWVSAANTVKVRFQNQSTVGPRDFASMSLRVRVIR